MTGGNWNSDCACAHVPSSMRSLHTFHADAEFCITEFSQCPRGFQKLYLAVSPEAYPSLGTWSRRLVVLLGSSKINPVGEKTQISLSHGAALSGLPVRPVHGLAGFAWAKVKLSPAEQRAHRVEPRVSWLMLAQAFHMVLPAEPTFSWISKSSLHKGMDAPGGLERDLNLAQTGSGRIIPWAVPQTTGEPCPSCPSTLLDRTAAPLILHPADEPPSKPAFPNEVYPSLFYIAFPS